MPAARHIHIPLNEAKHLLLRLKCITFGEMEGARDTTFDAIVETMKQLEKGIDHVEKKQS
jgi:hypothetical protein